MEEQADPYRYKRMNWTPEQMRERRRQQGRKSYAKRRTEILRRVKESYHAKQSEKRAKATARRLANLEQYRAAARERYHREMKTPNGKLSRAMRRAIQRMVEAGGIKAGKSVHLLGAGFTEIRNHIESLWAVGMSWENYGKWHIDHIKSLASFDLTDPGQFKAAAHYTNLQPVWAKINLSWGAKHA